MKRICLNKDSLQGRELSSDELLHIRGGVEMNSHYLCTFLKKSGDAGTECNYYVASGEEAGQKCMADYGSSDYPDAYCNCSLA